jgi:hypothetical protein
MVVLGPRLRSDASSGEWKSQFLWLWRPAAIFLIEDISLALKPGGTVPVNAWIAEQMKQHPRMTPSKDTPHILGSAACP